jgi:peptidoglycan/LPS O-acetylase OafA/YrhL
VFPFLFLLFTHSKLLNLSAVISGVLLIALACFFPANILCKTIVFYLPYFFIGVLLYKYGFAFSIWVQRIFLGLLVLIIALHYITPSLAALTVANKMSTYNDHLNQLLPLLMIPVIGGSVKQKSSSFDKGLGDISYVLYLCHWFWLIPYESYVRSMGNIERLPYTAVYITITLLSSYLVYRFFDMPVDKLRRRWIASQSAATLVLAKKAI